MAERCISGDFVALSNYSVTGNAAALGEASGRVAAAAALRGHSLEEIPFPFPPM